jgi:hypothetical protein
MNVRVYVKRFFYIFVALFSLVVGVNFVIDPLGIFHDFRIDKINKYVVINNDAGRLVNSIRLQENQYDIIVSGTSRVQSGIDPRSSAFGKARIYNASLGDTDADELNLQLDYIAKHQDELKHLIFGLDFHTFSSKRTIFPDYYNSLFVEKNSYWDIVGHYIFSYRSLGDIYLTVQANQKDSLKKYWIDGHNHVLSKGGFHKSMENILNYYMGKERMFGCFTYDFQRVLDLEKSLNALLRKGIKVSMFISPQHAKNLMMLENVGLFSSYYDWMRDITSMVARLDRIYKDKITLWNFSGFNSITTEPISDEKDDMKFYIETSHFKTNVGNYLMQTILENREVIEGFGHVIDQSSIEQEITWMKSDARQYSTNFPLDAVDLERVFNATKVERDGLGCY